MARFIGHTLPGILLVILGSWWTYSIWMKYFICQQATKSRTNRRSRYVNTSSFVCPCCPKIPFEGILKAIVVPFGMLAEYLTGFNADGKFVAFNNLQHLTIYFFFGLNGIMDIFTYYKWPLPQGCDYASAFLGLCMEGILFFYHLHGRTHLDTQVHMLLLFAILGCIVSVIVEMSKKHSVLAGLTRCYCVILQGTWLFQIGFMLYSPYRSNWKGEDHNDLMVATVLFCWHNAFIFVAMGLLGLLIYFRVKTLSSTSVYYSLDSLTNSRDATVENLNAQEVKNIIEDSEEDEVV